ncbi:hypothetical protein [Aquimarina algicola]|uniref:DUF4064 domain-containing protein n=1 Tax=Aquimarina algicola TaxID=2589995 RepID=A0A504IVC9_9FLAO|nr:hypothetical protein [Aquimarina algicola]TPN82306.1 hypothetical protein FHK87_23055 [Aquimarina algicola]
MKKSILSIIISSIGLYFIYWFNRRTCEIYAAVSETPEIDTSIFSAFGNVYKITAMCIGLVGFYVGLMAIRQKQKVAIIGIVLSIIVMMTSFLPLCEYYLSWLIS